jgi:hypothetical protein
MFGFFSSAKVKATCLADALNPLKEHASVDIYRITNKENIELQDEAFEILESALGKKKSYHSYEMVCATWLALLKILKTTRQHTLSNNLSQIEIGLRDYNSSVWDEVLRQDLGKSFILLVEIYSRKVAN